ncbi:MAG: DUF937 domain-containing protein [Clostridia bacterium]|nr:DUF937 domain-containing protein [Clostridia bacterium]
MSSIINILAKELMNDSSVKQIAKASGVKADQAENVIGNAIPLLVQAMSDNAGTKEGAESLFGALGQHASSESAAEQLKNTDAVDGDKIIGKILGSNKQGVTDALAKQAGITRGNTASILSLMAPVLLSLIGNQTNNNNTSSGGLSSLLSLFTDDDMGQNGAGNGLGSGMGNIGTALLMSALLGGGNNNNNSSGNLLGALLGGGNNNSMGAGLGGALLSSMLGGGSNSSYNNNNNNNGGGLLGALLGGGNSGNSTGLDGALLGNNNNSNNSNNSNDLGSGMGNIGTALLMSALLGGRQ